MKLIHRLGLFAVFAYGTATRLRSAGVEDRLEKDGEDDEKASENARCWCKEFSELLETRSRESDTELRYLGNRKRERAAANNVLRMEVADHRSQAADHKQSLDTGAAIMGKSESKYEEEREFHENAIAAIKKARDKIPDGAGADVSAALTRLENTFGANMDAAEKQQQAKFQGMRETKQEMLRLANAAAETKQDHLSEGEAVVAKASAEIAQYETRQEADGELSSALKSFCSDVESGAETRKQLRQAVAIAISEDKAERAHAAASKAATAVISFVAANSTSNRRTSSPDAAKESASELNQVLEKAARIEQDLGTAIQQVVQSAHLASVSSTTAVSVKQAMEKYSNRASSDVAALPSLSQAVSAAGRKSLLADSKLIAELSK